MNPLEQRIEQLEQKIARMEAASDISNDQEQALRTRLQLDSVSRLSVSSKSTDSEDVTVTQGAGTATVLDDPDHFLKVTINNTTYHIPAYNA